MTTPPPTPPAAPGTPTGPTAPGASKKKKPTVVKTIKITKTTTNQRATPAAKSKPVKKRSATSYKTWGWSWITYLTLAMLIVSLVLGIMNLTAGKHPAADHPFVATTQSNPGCAVTATTVTCTNAAVIHYHYGNEQNNYVFYGTSGGDKWAAPNIDQKNNGAIQMPQVIPAPPRTCQP